MSILEERCANFFFSVLYAPRTEGFGLDMRRKCTRDVVWQNEKALPPSLLDLRIVFFPETVGFAVCCISYG